MKKKSNTVKKKRKKRWKINGIFSRLKAKDTGKVNLVVFCTILILVAIGGIMVFSASSYYALHELGKSPYYFFIRQAGFIVAGIGFMLITMNIDYHHYKKNWVAYGLYGVTLITLIVVLMATPVNGATRWIDLGPFSFQPSEIAKYAIVILLAKLIIEKGGVRDNFFGIRSIGKIKVFWGKSLDYWILAGIYAVLILSENNLSITAVVMFVTFIMLFISGMRKDHIFEMISAGLVFGVTAIILSPYRLKRALNFINPFKDPEGEGYQLVRSFYALGSGGLFGVGLGNSKQKALYMPEPHNDFIFSILGEEFGFIGCLIVIFLFIILILGGISIIAKAKDRYGRLLATGIISVIAVQVIINIAVVSGSMPVTGVPLPFISYGGTSIIINLTVMGILLNISRQRKKVNNKDKEKAISTTGK